MVALALFLKFMGRKKPTSKNSLDENICTYCFFFQAWQPRGRPLKGNCTYHKEWIENAALTTCSDMSNQPLEEKGIYQLVSDDGNGWSYVRRTNKLRTRL